MKDIKNISLLFLAILTFIACRETKQPTDLKTVFESINIEAQKNGEGYHNLGKVCKEIGHRLTGSENGKKAEQTAFDLFKSYGLDVEFDEFEVGSWTRGNLTLSITGDENIDTLETVSLAYSPTTVDLLGKIVDVGNGLRNNFEAIKDQVKGNIVLLNIGIHPKDSTLANLHRTEKTALAIEYGAIGAIFMNKYPNRILLTGTASITGTELPIPAISIAYEDGMILRAVLKEKELTAHIEMNNSLNPIKARNVIATIKGSELPEERILIGGHLDSWDLSPCAIDNGVGSFTVIEIARIFAALNLKPKRTVQFVAFMGEEEGLLGSTAYAKKLMDNNEMEQIKYFVNLDMASNTIGFNIMGRREADSFCIKVGELIQEIDSTFPNKLANHLGTSSDHFSFAIEGVPTLETISDFADGIFQYYHSNADNFELVDEQQMKNCARYTGMMLYALADADTLPARQYTQEEVGVLFEKIRPLQKPKALIFSLFLNYSD